MPRHSSFAIPLFDIQVSGESASRFRDLLTAIREEGPAEILDLAHELYANGLFHPLVMGIRIAEFASEGDEIAVRKLCSWLVQECLLQDLAPPPEAWRDRWIATAVSVAQGHRKGGGRMVNLALREMREHLLRRDRSARGPTPRRGRQRRSTGSRKQAVRPKRATPSAAPAPESAGDRISASGIPGDLPAAARVIWDRVDWLPEEPPDPGLPAMELCAVVDAPGASLLRRIDARDGPDGLARARLAREAVQLGRTRHFDRLLALDHVSGVEHFPHQIETVRRVLRDLNGSALLADEVGLGKTIEAGLIAKEAILRGQVRSVLVLCPPSLVRQWQEELASKFGLEFAAPGTHPEEFFDSGDLLVCSLAFARRQPNLERATARRFDLVIVDEAHHVKNRRTAGFELVDRLKRRFLLLLTATPVQNQLDELFNLVTLLRPGHLGTRGSFSRLYVVRGDPRLPRDREQLRERVAQVMIRNTRALVDVSLPPRFVRTVRVDPTAVERELYEAISDHVRARAGAGTERQLLMTLLTEAGSSPAAVHDTIGHMLERGTVSPPDVAGMRALMERSAAVTSTSKDDTLLRLVRDAGSEHAIVFVQYRATLAFLQRRMEAVGLDCVVLHGGLPAADRQRAVDEFRERTPLLLSMGSGGEGWNLQFCRRLINYDLPWNPFVIEQRIGRIHRIGQEREVYVANLCARQTAEEYLLEVLDEKLNMFELVIGELDMILGDMDDELDLPGRVWSIWTAARDEREVQRGFEELGDELIRARQRYEEERTLDENLFGRDYEVN